VFIGHLDELREVAVEEDAVSVGASCTLSSILEDERVPPLLRTAIRSIAGPSIRNRATIGGNICNASPAADSLPALSVLGAEVVLRCREGTRTLPIDAFIVGPGETCLRRGELLTAVRVPVNGQDISFFRKVGTRAAYSCAKLSLAGVAQIGEGKVRAVRLALGSVAPTVVRSAEAEELMRDKTPGEIRGELYQILKAYNDVIDPIDDQRSTSAYRLKASFRLILYFIGRVLLPHIEKNA
jgi:CO/xanthine dehydrogenase FAD-binding subunit